MSYIIIGNGQLGKEFANYFEVNKTPYLMIDHKTCSIEDMSEVLYVFGTYKIGSEDVVINCAAYNEVDGAEYGGDIVFKVNAIGPKNLAIACNKNNTKLVHFSTDYVFGDTKETYIFRDEFAKTKPKSKYGSSKLQGEKFIKDHCNDYLILRTSWLYGKYGQNFISKILKKANDKRCTIELSRNIESKPTYAKDLVAQTMHLLNNNRCGLYHAAGEGVAVSWYNYCEKIFQILNIKKPIHSTTYLDDDRNIRPNSSALSNSMLKLEGLNIMRDWEVALEDYLLNDMEK